MWLSTCHTLHILYFRVLAFQSTYLYIMHNKRFTYASEYICLILNVAKVCPEWDLWVNVSL